MTTVLLVDDDAFVRRILGAFLEHSGFTLLAAADSHCAIQLAQGHQGRIQILIADIQMPGMSGPELAAHLVQSRPDLKVLLISSMDGAPSPLPDGWGFLRKPFQPEALLETLAEFSVS